LVSIFLLKGVDHGTPQKVDSQGYLPRKNENERRFRAKRKGFLGCLAGGEQATGALDVYPVVLNIGVLDEGKWSASSCVTGDGHDGCHNDAVVGLK
jgi:hypothetical protein